MKRYIFGGLVVLLIFSGIFVFRHRDVFIEGETTRHLTFMDKIHYESLDNITWISEDNQSVVTIQKVDDGYLYESNQNTYTMLRSSSGMLRFYNDGNLFATCSEKDDCQALDVEDYAAILQLKDMLNVVNPLNDTASDLIKLALATIFATVSVILITLPDDSIARFGVFRFTGISKYRRYKFENDEDKAWYARIQFGLLGIISLVIATFYTFFL